MVDLTPVDYLSGLGGLGNLPNPAQEQSIAQGLRTTELQQQVAALQLDQERQKQQRSQLFQRDIMGLGNDPNPLNIAGMIRKYPEFAEQLKSAHEIQDQAKRDSDFAVQAQVYSAAANGKYDLAAQQLQSFVDAEVAAGQEADPADLAIITALKSGDPAEQKRALSMIGLSVAAINPKKFSETYKALNGEGGSYTLAPGSKRFDPNGELIAEAPFAPEFRNVGAGDTVVQIDPNTPSGGTPSGSSPTAALGPAIESRVQSLVPGVTVTSRARTPEHNAEVGGVPNSKHLTDNARDFVPPEGVSMAQLEQSLRAGLPGGFRVINEGDHVHVQAAGRPAAAQGGGSRVVAQGAPKPGYRVLSAQEVGAIPGLDVARAYQISPDGQITAIGGNDRGQLKPWPATPATSHASNVAAVQNIQGAIDLLRPPVDPKDKSAKAQKARREAAIANGAIGPGTGMLGDWVTQWNNPEGTDARARIGQIGGIIIKDTSGAAVSLSEDRRLAKWVPLITDRPQVALAKLNNLKRELTQRNEILEDTFSEEQGYRKLGAKGDAPTGFKIISVRPK